MGLPYRIFVRSRRAVGFDALFLLAEGGECIHASTARNALRAYLYERVPTKTTAYLVALMDDGRIVEQRLFEVAPPAAVTPPYTITAV